MYLQAFGDYVRIITSEKTYITKERFQHITEQLHYNFFTSTPFLCRQYKMG